MTNSGIPLNVKRRSAICPNPGQHPPHEGCPGRKRAAKTDRPTDPLVASEVGAHLGHLVSTGDHTTLGILSPEQIAEYSLEMESYEAIQFVQEQKLASFFTAVQRTNAIILEYAAQGLLPLTLRQIHYQHVVRHKISYPNTQKSYDHICEDLVAGRMCGLVPWNAIDDPTRGLHEWMFYDSVKENLELSVYRHRLDRWRNQEFVPIVLVEKDAALTIIKRACDLFYVPYCSLKGYGSLSTLRNHVAKYCIAAIDGGRTPIVIQLSDHDSSGWDMPRNLIDYLNIMVRQTVEVRHVALTLDQIAEGYGDGNPLPADPVKDKDPRSPKYVAMLAERGLPPGAWEMDAISPAVLHDLIIGEIERLRDPDKWKEVEAQEQEEKAIIQKMADDYETPDTESVEAQLQVMRELLAE
jgi:hypothetical protein